MKNILFCAITLSLLLTGCGLTSLTEESNSPEPYIENSAKNEASPLENNKPPVLEKKPIANKLDLSNQQLEKVPEYVFKEKGLEELNLSNNKLTGAIQAEIRRLENLRILDASNNQMTGVPAEIGQLKNLETLNLSNNQLTGLPYELGNLKNLKTFNISGNNYSEQDLKIIMEGLSDSVNIIK